MNNSITIVGRVGQPPKITTFQDAQLKEVGLDRPAKVVQDDGDLE